jgi:hypothetical protein
LKLPHTKKTHSYSLTYAYCSSNQNVCNNLSEDFNIKYYTFGEKCTLLLNLQKKKTANSCYGKGGFKQKL